MAERGSREEFDTMDVDGDGFITVAEWKDAAQEGRLPEGYDAIQLILSDRDRDQRISYEEYRQHLGT
jgi:Ca2+-binding EF-hand superfamily protein